MSLPNTRDEWVNYWAEEITQAVYDMPSIETREEFRIAMAGVLGWFVALVASGGGNPKEDNGQLRSVAMSSLQVKDLQPPHKKDGQG